MSDSRTDPLWGLPDPDTHAAFYEDVVLKRFLAWIVDTVLIALLTLVAIPLTFFAGLFFIVPLFLLVSFAYRTVTIARVSATPGMQLAGIEFRNFRGERFDTPTAALHTAAYLIMSTIFVIQIVSIILMLTTARRQGLHDLALGTAAVNRGRKT
jgi:uncharacterized RDD family membrane protein YckC